MTQGSTRRTILATGAVALAAGCSESHADSDNSSLTPPTASSKPLAKPASVAPSHGPAAGGKEVARTSDIPVGGGKILDDQRIVVTQPAKGEFKAFTTDCTHQGCSVSQVVGGTIRCPCHGSLFRVTDGSVAHGPATRPLDPVKIEVAGNSIRLT
jgi:Rieske Fe-S protein